MYISFRGVFIRNLAAALVNGAITLTILLIAPLGLAAVILNTMLVMISTFIVCTAMDWIVTWLIQPSQARAFFRTRPRKDINVGDRWHQIESKSREKRDE